jgi:hypothetical protein
MHVDLIDNGKGRNGSYNRYNLQGSGLILLRMALQLR